jgi:hypothetical protein
MPRRHSLPLIDAARSRGFAVQNAIADKGYDNAPFHDGCMDRGIAPVTPLRERPTVVRGEHKPPTCEHREWTFAGADYKRRAAKWRCPTGECQPEVALGQGRPAAPADPAGDGALREAVPLTRRRRARVRAAQARMGAIAVARPWTGSRSAARRPDDPSQARLRSESSASRTPRGLAAPPTRVGCSPRESRRRKRPSRP